MTLNGFGRRNNEENRLVIYFLIGNGTVDPSHIPIGLIRRRKEKLKREIQVNLFEIFCSY